MPPIPVSIRRPLVTTVCATAGLMALALSPVVGRGQSPTAASPMTSLSVPGRTNAHATVAADGDFVFVAWSAAQDKITDVYVATSRDAGRTFGAPVRVNREAGDVSLGAERPPHVAVGRRLGHRIVGVLWTARGKAAAGGTALRLAESTDDAQTFASTRTLHDEALSGLRSWESLAFGPDGAAHAAWLDGRNAARHDASHAAHDSAAHTKAAPRQDLFYAMVTTDGRVEERLLAADVCFCCKTATVVDGRGTVSVAWRHIFPESERDIALAQSRAGGVFTQPLRVSPDRWKIHGCPDDGSALAVDGGARLHIVWPTLIGGTDGRKAIFYASSTDGRTFTPRQRVDRAAGLASHPQITVGASGVPAMAWDEAIDGRRQVWLRVAADKSATSWGDPLALGAAPGSGTYPAVAMSGQTIVAVWTHRTGEASVIGSSRVLLAAAQRPSH